MNIKDEILEGKISLSTGSHESPEIGMCVMEMVSFLADEKWSDTPVCVSKVVGHFSRSLNDRLPEELRNELQTRIPPMMETGSDDLDLKRVEFLAWEVASFYLPLILNKQYIDDYEKQLSSSNSLSETADILNQYSNTCSVASHAYFAVEAAARQDIGSACLSCVRCCVRYGAITGDWEQVLKTLDMLLEITKQSNQNN